MWVLAEASSDSQAPDYLEHTLTAYGRALPDQRAEFAKMVLPALALTSEEQTAVDKAEAEFKAKWDAESIPEGSERRSLRLRRRAGPGQEEGAPNQKRNYLE